ncbi:hypothetical protein CspeluHIS016_0105410 [Cutaneotrichosporon spelunceum]|uniref:ABC transporter domain-containing protein n=1 Tax=Cutaneotrichosporon spelunceum TaxID=1672016 RepID=A0AAD3TNK0_9TREE|nr:hypothetical protein CspeluHIS016_0105410 [Cutaneotrichosporon spelunceum]
MSAAPSSSKADAPSNSSPAPPPKPTDYRSTAVDDDDDDEDLDDLDDVLDSLNAPPKPAAKAASQGTSSASPAPAAGPSAEGGDDFEADLMEEMQALLRTLGEANPAMRPPPALGGKASDVDPGAGSEDDDKAFQRTLEMMMSGEMEAMGFGKNPSTGPSARGPPKEKGQALKFEETIKRAMESVNTGGANAGAGASDELPGDLAALLKQLGEDPSALDGFGDDDDELGGLLDGMMAQLMSKEVLEEPMMELASKYPAYLEKPPAGITPTDVDKYRKQHELVKEILVVFKRPAYTDDKDGKEVARLVGEMQDLGGPPNEIMGDLPEGMDLGALGGEDGCDLPNCGGSLYEPAAAAPGLGNTTGCACTDGWGGPACTVCKSASACVSGLSKFSNSSNAITSETLNTTMTCSNVPTVYSSSQMACSVNQPTLQALFPGVSQLTITRSLNSSRVPGSDRALNQAGIASGTAEAWAQLWLNGIEQFYCHATECNQTITQGSSVNSSLWDCAGLACTCRPGAAFCGGGATSTQNLSGPINGLKGPLSVDCGDGGTCQFKQSFLNSLFGANGLTLTDCSFGECVEQYVINEAMGIVGATSGSTGLSGGVIAGLAVVGAILLGIVLVTIWGVIVRNKARKAAGDGSLEKRSSGVALSWSGVGYEIKSHGRGLYATTLRWLRGWGSLKSHAHDQEDGSGVGPNGGRIVLRDTYGALPPGGFCCVLGPSGAGKSTLIDILAGKRKAGRVEGKVTYLTEGHRRVKIGYCDQADVLSPTATVIETLQFAAYLRLPENVPKAVKDERAMQVLRDLGLEHIAQTRVGSGEHRGISGGEMRRVSIGVELVANPDVLVLDEPTSGLDSVSAARIVSLLKTLAQEHRTTVIASIHQPSSALYQSFSQVLLLANGRQLYFGPGGAMPAEFFAKHGYPCPPGYNVADHLIEIASENPQDLPTGAAAALSTQSPSDSNTSDHSHKDEQDNHAVKTLSRMSNEFDLAQVQQASRQHTWWPTTHPATTFLTQLGVLATREWRMLMRDKTLLVTHILVSAVIGVFAGGLYFNVNLTIAGFQNRVGSLFFLGALISFTSLSALNNMVEMRPLFLRERSGDYYSPQAWLTARLLFDIVPLRILPTIIVSVILYFMVGLAAHAANFFKFLLIAVEFAIVMALYNFLLPSVFTHPSVATLLSSAFVLFNLTFAGFFINISNIPPVLRWLRYLAPLGYMLEALTVNEVGSGLMIVDVLQGVPIEISAVPIMHSLFGFSEGNYYRNVLVLFGWIAGFLVLLVGTVVYFLREKR